MIDGVLLGDRPNLARNRAMPIVEPDAFLAWLREQGELLARQRAESWHIRVAATFLAYGLELPDLPLCEAEMGMPMRRADLVDWARDADEIPILVGGELEDWLIESGLQESRVDEITILTPFLSWGDQRAIDFSAYGLPAPISTANVDALVEQAIADAWESAGPLRRVDEVVMIGSFDDTDDDVDILPERTFRRDPGGESSDG